MLYTAPIYITLLSRLTLKEAITRHSLSALVLSLVGVILVIRPGAVFYDKHVSHRAWVRTDLGSALCLHDPDLQISEGLLHRNGTGSVGNIHNPDNLPTLFCRHIMGITAGQPVSTHTPGYSSYSYESDTLLQWSYACQGTECQHYRAAGAH